MASWVAVEEGSPFPIQNLPYGVFSTGGSSAGGSSAGRVGAAIGSRVVDLAGLAEAGLLGVPGPLFRQPSLNRFMAAGPAVWSAVRRRLVDLLGDASHRVAVSPFLLEQGSCRLHRPVEPADYVDFYSSLDHATNLGRILRPSGEPLSPNWRHLPVGYHGRTGTIVVSGTPVARPWGQRHGTGGDDPPEFGPSTRLDLEAEVGFVVGVGRPGGQRLAPSGAEEHIFGVVLVNDWSARDIQAWESVPLGPFLAKSWATSMSAWVVPLEALAAARVAPPRQVPAPLPYLRSEDPWTLDLALEVRINGHVVSRPRFATTYWSPGQQLAHLTSNGTPLRTGDLWASGTVSGPAPDQYGSLIELADNGRAPLTLPDGTTRSWLDDGDTVTISAWAPGRDGVPIGLGPVSGTVAPAA